MELNIFTLPCFQGKIFSDQSEDYTISDKIGESRYLVYRNDLKYIAITNSNIQELNSCYVEWDCDIDIIFVITGLIARACRVTRNKIDSNSLLRIVNMYFISTTKEHFLSELRYAISTEASKINWAVKEALPTFKELSYERAITQRPTGLAPLTKAEKAMLLEPKIKEGEILNE